MNLADRKIWQTFSIDLQEIQKLLVYYGLFLSEY